MFQLILYHRSWIFAKKTYFNFGFCCFSSAMPVIGNFISNVANVRTASSIFSSLKDNSENSEKGRQLRKKNQKRVQDPVKHRKWSFLTIFAKSSILNVLQVYECTFVFYFIK